MSAFDSASTPRPNGSSSAPEPRVLAAGYRSALEELSRLLAEVPVRLTLADEETFDLSSPDFSRPFDRGLLVFEGDTPCSSQLHGLFDALRHRVRCSRWWVVEAAPFRRDGTWIHHRDLEVVPLGQVGERLAGLRTEEEPGGSESSLGGE